MRKMIKTLHAYSLFANGTFLNCLRGCPNGLHAPLTGQFPRAMEYYLELDLDPLQVIGLYPNLLPKNLRDKFSYPIEPPQLGACFEVCCVSSHIRPS